MPATKPTPLPPLPAAAAAAEGPHAAGEEQQEQGSMEKVLFHPEGRDVLVILHNLYTFVICLQITMNCY